MLYGQSHFLDAFLIRKTTSIFYFQESLLSAASASYMDNQRLLYNKKNHAILVSFFVRKFTFCIGLFKIWSVSLKTLSVLYPNQQHVSQRRENLEIY